jgi:hypothetical protein
VKEKTPLSVKLEPEVHARLEECARRTRLKKYALALMAIEAAVDAIEKNDYRLVVPIQFDVTQIPVERAEPGKSSSLRYPSASAGDTVLNEPATKPKKKIA